MSNDSLVKCELPVSRADDLEVFVLKKYEMVKSLIDLACWLHYSLGILLKRMVENLRGVKQSR